MSLRAGNETTGRTKGETADWIVENDGTIADLEDLTRDLLGRLWAGR